MLVDASPVFVYILPATFKFAIGSGLVWVNVELSMSIYYSRKTMRKSLIHGSGNIDT